MASSSSSLSNIRRYHVFPSFHGPDVRRGFLSHVHNLFASKGITTFKDQKIERGHSIGPELIQAIRESRVSIVVLSNKYASSSWCLDELVEILKCKQDQGQIVMTVFYDVEPSDVRKQNGDFGNTFEKTCQGRTEEEKQRWIQALTDVANIAGEHSLHWDDEAEMIEKIAIDVSNKLNLTPSKDFDGMVGMVGMETHLAYLYYLLCLESNDVKMIGIQGPAGIGKTTIARALFNLLSTDFTLSCFMGNLKGSYGIIMGADDYDSKCRLQSQLLSKILKHNDLKIQRLDAIKEWLQDQRVLVVLDDVDDLEQLDALAKEPSWFGLGSRIVITTKDQKILKAHWGNDIYHVGYPSEEEALEILCLSAFKQSSPCDGFEELATKVTKICGNLPLGLRVVGVSLRGDSRDEWECQLSKLESSIDTKIEDVLKVGYHKLSKKEQSLFLHIAFFFNNQFADDVTTMLTGSMLDVKNGLRTLADQSLVDVNTSGYIKMHCLLQQLGRQIVRDQSDEPGKRQFLEDAEEIHDVLANKTGTGSILGITLGTSEMSEFSISGQAFEGMHNLRFLRIDVRYSHRLQLSEDLEYLPRLRLLHWPAYPKKSLPLTFQAECLVELYMPSSGLEKLWEDSQNLKNLKNIDLNDSKNLIEIPDLSKATNLEILALEGCTSLVELPSSIKNLHKLIRLGMRSCEELQVVPTNINLASLEEVDMNNCSKLRIFPDISMNIRKLNVNRTDIEEVHPSIVACLSRLDWLQIGSRNLKTLSHVPGSISHLDLSNSVIERIPDCVMGLPQLISLFVRDCRKLVSLQGLPPLLSRIDASNCTSLEKVCLPCNDNIRELMFNSCYKLDKEASRVILQQRVGQFVFIPGRKVPAEFIHGATGNSITISCGSFFAYWRLRFRACLLLSPVDFPELHITCRLLTKGGVIITEYKWDSIYVCRLLAKHLFICGGYLGKLHKVDMTRSEITFEFRCYFKHLIIECGVQLLSEETENSSYSYRDEVYESGGSSELHTDGDEDFESESFQASQSYQLLYGEEDDDALKTDGSSSYHTDDVDEDYEDGSSGDLLTDWDE